MRRTLLSLFLVFNALAFQASTTRYNVGDRVDVTIHGGGKGTILEVGHGVPYEGYYKVHFDGLHHSDPKDGMWVNPNTNAIKRLGSDGRPMPEGPTTQEKAEAPKQTAPNKPNDNAKPGSLEANFKELIRSRYHSAHGVTQDVEFHTFQVRPQSQYEHVYSANGRGHVYMAWPVVTTYRVTEHYQGEDLIREYDGKYWCFKDVHGEWLAVQAGEMKISPARYVKK